MNLLARGKWWKLFIILLIWGCKDDLGIEVPPGQERTEGTFVELNLPVSNVYFDSLRTDNVGRLLVGEYTDPVYGKVTAESYFEFVYKGGLFQDSLVWIDRILNVNPDSSVFYADSLTNLVFESATLRLRINQIIGDGSEVAAQDLIVESLKDSIFASTVYLNDRSIQTEEEIGREATRFLFRSDITPSIFEEDTFAVEIDVTSDFASDVFANLVEVGTSAKSRGIKLSGDQSNSLWSFAVSDDTTEIQLDIKGEIYDTTGLATYKKDTVLTTTFRITTANHFINIKRDFSGTIFEGIQDKEEVSINSGEAYYNPVAGIYPKVDLSPFRDFAETQEEFLATLGNMQVVIETNPSNIPYVDPTRFYFSNTDNGEVNVNWPGVLRSPDVYSTILLSDNSYLGGAAPSPQSMQIDTLESSELGFQRNFTAFWQSIHQNVQNDIDGVDVEDRSFPNSFLSDVNNFILYPSDPTKLGQLTIAPEGVKVKIYYTKLKD